MTPQTVAHEAPLSMGFPRQEYWSGLPFPSPDLTDPGIKPTSPALVVRIFTTEPQGSPWKVNTSPESAPMLLTGLVGGPRPGLSVPAPGLCDVGSAK